MVGRNKKFFTDEKYKTRVNPTRDGRAWDDWRRTFDRRVFRDILHGLQFLHKQKIIHRDLKPENILCDAVTIDWKICDFGLAKHFEGQAMFSTFCGTMLYAAPEQLAIGGNKEYGLEADIYPLGLIMFELLYPFKSMDDLVEHCVKLRSRKEFPLPFTKIAKLALCARKISKTIDSDPKNRPTIDDLVDNLTEYWKI